MADIQTVWNVSEGDWAMAGADLATGDDLETAVIISLFTDATAAADETLPGDPTDPRGWWGDAGETKAIGSKLWLYGRSKQTPQVLAGIQKACAAALAWLVEDGVVARVDVAASWIGPAAPQGAVGVVIDLWQRSGVRTSLNYGWAWAQLAGG